MPVQSTTNIGTGIGLSGDETTSAGDHPRPAGVSRLPNRTLINGRYEIVSVLGEGGMGIVYEARDKLRQERRLALKTLKGDALRGGLLSLFKAEFKIMTDLHHPNVAAVYDFEPMAGTADHLFTMECIAGQDALRATAGASLDRILAVTVQICRALTIVHTRGFIHRDLKPTNVLVDVNGHVKVLDFGIARRRSAEDADGSIEGTMAYMAPEAFGDQRAVDHRADLYSLGVLLYQLLCRTLPFHATTATDLRQHHLTTPVAFDAAACQRVPEWLRAIVVKLCAKDVAERFRSGNAVIDAINAGGACRYELETAETKKSYILSPRFVGREQEFDRLHTFIASRLSVARAAMPPVALVAGSSGAGKSRLMREVRHRCQLDRRAFVESDCYEGATAEFAPVADVARFVIRIAESRGAGSLVEQYASDLARVDPALVAGRDVAPVVSTTNSADAERFALFENVCAFFVKVAESVPLTLYFNDLQWARLGAVDWLAHLAQLVSTREKEGRPVPLAVIGSYRDDEVAGRPVERLINRLRDRRQLETVALASLDAEQSALLISSMLGAQSLPAEFVARVVAETGGNPFFVEEVMRALVDRDLVFVDRGQWAARVTVGELEIPRGVARAFQRRLDAIAPGERALVDLLAVVARPVSAEFLARAARLPVDEAHARLLSLTRRNIAVCMQGDGDTMTYRFAHDRMREVAYAELKAAERREMHRTFFEIFASGTDADRRTHLYDLAEHAWHGGLEDEARRYGLEAGRRAKHAFANGLAFELLSRTLRLWDNGDDAGRLALVEDLGDVRTLLGDIDAAVEDYRRVLRSGGDRLVLARLHRKTGYLFMQRLDIDAASGEFSAALRHLGRRAAAQGRAGAIWSFVRAGSRHLLQRLVPWTARSAGDSAEEAVCAELVENYLALALLYRPFDPIRTGACVLAAANVADRLGPSRPLARARAYLAMLYCETISYGTAKAYAASAVALSEQLNLPWNVAESSAFQSYVLTAGGEAEVALAAAQRARTLFAKHGDMYMFGVSNCLTLLGFVALGRLEEANTYVEDALQTLERHGVLAVANPVCMKCAAVRTELGDLDRGLQQQRIAVERAERLNADVSWAHLYMAISMSAIGEDGKALEHLQRSLHVRESQGLVDFIGSPVYALTARAQLGKLKVTDDERERSAVRASVRTLVKKALRTTRRLPLYRADALTVQAQFLWYEGRRTQALRRFDEALSLSTARGARLMLADTHYELARCLRESAEPAEAARGEKHMAEARRLYEACGATLRIQRIAGQSAPS